MSKVTIRRCPTCNTIRSHTDLIVAALKREKGIQVEVVDGAKGEFTVQVDGRNVAQLNGESMPDVNEVLAAVNRIAPAGATA